MRALAKAAGGCALAAALAGCLGSQSLVTREYYEPNEKTLTRREDGYAVGAIKSETIKSGSRDEGERDFSFGLVNLNR